MQLTDLTTFLPPGLTALLTPHVLISFITVCGLLFLVIIPQTMQDSKHLHSMRMVLGIQRQLEMIRNLWKNCIMCKHCSVFCKGLEHLWVWGSLHGVLEPIHLGYQEQHSCDSSSRKAFKLHEKIDANIMKSLEGGVSRILTGGIRRPRQDGRWPSVPQEWL